MSEFLATSALILGLIVVSIASIVGLIIGWQITPGIVRCMAAVDSEASNLANNGCSLFITRTIFSVVGAVGMACLSVIVCDTLIKFAGMDPVVSKYLGNKASGKTGSEIKSEP